MTPPEAPGDPAVAEPRYEVKLVCEERSGDALLAHLRLQPFGLRRLYPPRRVQSVYLDTHDGRALEENLAGVADREKIRFRWYGPAVRAVHGRLERKVRSNLLGTKEILEIDQPIDVDGATRRGLIAALRRHAPPAWRDRLGAGLEPAQWVAYERRYLTTADRTVRVTVDTDLWATDLRFCPVIDRRHPSPLPRLLVVECKADLSRRRQLEEVVQAMPLLVDRCSKFVLASAPQHAPLVSLLGW